MSKEEVVSQVIQVEPINEKEHEWKDQELYSELSERQEIGCWDRMSRGCTHFLNRTIDYFQFDRIFDLQGERRIDLRRCQKRFLQNFDQTYSERELRFGYNFTDVLRDKQRQEQKREKGCCSEFCRFICCEGGNQMIELDEYYISEKRYQVLIKERIMQKRKKEYQEFRQKEQQEQANNKQMVRETVVVTETIVFEEGEGSKNKQTDPSKPNTVTHTKKVKVDPSANQNQTNMLIIHEQDKAKSSDRTKEKSKEGTADNNDELQPQNSRDGNKNKVSKSKGTSSKDVIKSNRGKAINQNVVNRNIPNQEVNEASLYFIPEPQSEYHLQEGQKVNQNQGNEEIKEKKKKKKKHKDESEIQSHNTFIDTSQVQNVSQEHNKIQEEEIKEKKKNKKKKKDESMNSEYNTFINTTNAYNQSQSINQSQLQKQQELPKSPQLIFDEGNSPALSPNFVPAVEKQPNETDIKKKKKKKEKKDKNEEEKIVSERQAVTEDIYAQGGWMADQGYPQEPEKVERNDFNYPAQEMGDNAGNVGEGVKKKRRKKEKKEKDPLMHEEVIHPSQVYQPEQSVGLSNINASNVNYSQIYSSAIVEKKRRNKVLKQHIDEEIDQIIDLDL